jgi:prepilin-type N-terminal cleavage/methylation domain-containing protein
MNTQHRAFSLIELLVAMVILTTLTVIIVPRFLQVRERAAYVNARGQLVKLEEITQNWLALGGQINGASPTELLLFLSQKGNQTSASRTPDSPAMDSPNDCGSWYISLNTDINKTAPAKPGFNDLGDGLFYYFSDKTEIKFLINEANHWYTDPAL